MASLGQAKSLGGVGSILVLIAGFIPSAGFVVAIIGFILILIAVKYVSDAFTDRTIFNNMIIAVILAILGFVAFFVAVLGAIYSFVGIGGFSSFMPGTFMPGAAPSAGVIALFTSIIIGWVIAWVFFLVGSIFLKRSYDTVAMKLNVGMFHTTGLLYLIGAALTIIFVGLVIVFIAEILQIVAFFSIPEQMPMGPQPMPGQTGIPPPAGTM